MISNPRVETDFVMGQIEQAKKVWLGTYHVQPDERVGLPLLKALERVALKEGSEVKFFTSDFAGWNGDIGNFTGYFLDHVASYTH